MQKQKFSDLYLRNNLFDELDRAIILLEDLENQFYDIDEISENILDSIISYLVKKNLNSLENFIILMRYYKTISRNDLFIHLTRYTGMLDVIENILKRLKSSVENAIFDKITEGYATPFLGVSPYELPNYADDLMQRLSNNLDEDLVEKVLTGNNHSLSEASQLPEKIEYENSESLEQYLEARHKRKVEELTKHYQENKVWFEQTITKEVIDFVASNQEVLSAKLIDNKLYITKIPYDTLAYLNANDTISKKYFGCHCPFAREAIKSGKPKLSEKFCYCSAGFAKFPFEVILGQKLAIKCLETILGDSEICRFEIDLKDVTYKK